MEDIYVISAVALSQDANTLRAVSQNVSNVSTPGYKREIPYQKAFGTLFENDSVPALKGASRAGTTAPSKVYDLSTGTLKKTGHALDVAILGEGYFELQFPDGVAYTRKGDFHLDREGRLVSAQEAPVIGTGGEILLDSNDIVISESGEIRNGDRILGSLKVVRFEKTAVIDHVGSGVVRVSGVINEEFDSKVQLRQGYLENSNVSLASEMLQVMQTMRHFESVQRVAQQYDELMGNAIRKLSEG